MQSCFELLWRLFYQCGAKLRFFNLHKWHTPELKTKILYPRKELIINNICSHISGISSTRSTYLIKKSVNFTDYIFISTEERWSGRTPVQPRRDVSAKMAKDRLSRKHTTEGAPPRRPGRVGRTALRREQLNDGDARMIPRGIKAGRRPKRKTSRWQHWGVAPYARTVRAPT
jgi:hypothetical protein